jgi:hypothetical protein
VQKPYGIPWFIAGVEGSDMKQINTYALYQLANQLAPLRSTPLTGLEVTKDHAMQLLFAGHWIQQFFIDSPVFPLELSADAAKALSEAMNTVVNKAWTDPPTEIYDWECRAIQTGLADLGTC